MSPRRATPSMWSGVAGYALWLGAILLFVPPAPSAGSAPAIPPDSDAERAQLDRLSADGMKRLAAFDFPGAAETMLRGATVSRRYGNQLRTARFQNAAAGAYLRALRFRESRELFVEADTIATRLCMALRQFGQCHTQGAPLQRGRAQIQHGTPRFIQTAARQFERLLYVAARFGLFARCPCGAFQKRIGGFQMQSNRG